jgi:hypothetical protein
LPISQWIESHDRTIHASTGIVNITTSFCGFAAKTIVRIESVVRIGKFPNLSIGEGWLAG